MIGSLLKIASAPLRIVDAAVLKPIADVAEEAAKAVEEETR